MGDFLQSNTEESCSSYNMLKIARNLYRWTKDVYADYYERTLTNGVLSIGGTKPGVMIHIPTRSSGVDYSEGEEVKLKCKSDGGGDSSDGTMLLFNKAVSFVAGKGLKQYHPISFIAKGLNRSYLMEPIHSFADEFTMWASIHNEVVKEKMDAIVGNLSLCQKKMMNTGYLSAFPTELFDRLEALHEFV
ncbi:hypothetical protein K1719_014232 [Acacia pycnantha]|nr:hypothetical protein K1719_014232 [Acacia pycnantha]